jgi:hypothetical protein
LSISTANRRATSPAPAPPSPAAWRSAHCQLTHARAGSPGQHRPGRTDTALLDTYDAERHPIGAAVVKQTSRGTNVMASGGLEARMRDLGLLLLGHVPALGERVITEMTETAVNYRRRLGPTVSAGVTRSPATTRPTCPACAPSTAARPGSATCSAAPATCC